MTRQHQFIGLDLGAESGRCIVVTLRDSKVEMQEIHRWPNRPVRLAGTLYWDVPFLFGEIIEGLRRCAEAGIDPEGISVDTWGVDFGLLGKDGKLLGNPVHYRDSRTEGIHEYSEAIMSRDEIFRLTAYEPWAISSLFQLASMQRDGSELLDVAQTFLNMPDLFGYLLTGRKVSEMSIANTSNLMATDCTWAEEIIERFSLRREMFCDLVEPATVLGPLQPAVAKEVGMGEVPVIATCGHDTSAALAAVPAEGDDWAFISCGTWSVLGSLVDKPVATPRCLELGFCNEYTIGGWYLARNISGLWLVQQLRKKWDRSEDPWDYTRMTQEAAAAESGALVDAADDSLLAPADMEEALLTLIRASGQAEPVSRGQLIRCVLESLALEYSRRIDALGELLGKRPAAIYMVGGGIHNKLLCQLTADACDLSVHAGADQCTAMGNALGQALALGILKDPQEIRQVMRESFEVTTYQPSNEDEWGQKRKRYADLCGTTR